MVENGFVFFDQNNIVVFSNERTTKGRSDLSSTNNNNFHRLPPEYASIILYFQEKFIFLRTFWRNFTKLRTSRKNLQKSRTRRDRKL